MASHMPTMDLDSKGTFSVYILDVFWIASALSHYKNHNNKEFTHYNPTSMYIT